MATKEPQHVYGLKLLLRTAATSQNEISADPPLEQNVLKDD